MWHGASVESISEPRSSPAANPPPRVRFPSRPPERGTVQAAAPPAGAGARVRRLPPWAAGRARRVRHPQPGVGGAAARGLWADGAVLRAARGTGRAVAPAVVQRAGRRRVVAGELAGAAARRAGAWRVRRDARVARVQRPRGGAAAQAGAGDAGIAERGGHVLSEGWGTPCGVRCAACPFGYGPNRTPPLSGCRGRGPPRRRAVADRAG